MDAQEATKIVFQRVQNLDPQNASKIMGFLLIQDHGEKELIRLALAPESLVHSVIIKTRKELSLASPSTPSSPNSPFGNPIFSLSRQSSSSSSSSRVPSPLSMTNIQPWAAVSSSFTNSKSSSFSDFQTSASFSDEVDFIDELQLQEQLSFLNDDAPPHLGPSISSDLTASPTAGEPLLAAASAASWSGASALHHRRSFSVTDICLGSDDLSGEVGWRPCLFYAKGYCKNGTTCRFLHGAGEATAEDGCAVGPPSKLEMMEQKYQELLRSKSTHHQQLISSNIFPFPSSLAAPSKCMNILPIPPGIPRGLIMGEMTNKFVGRGDFGSRQIYLTFPADSSFKEDDVSNYFSNFGPVEDVRIPYQQKRMFGFVTFDFPETVKLILATGNPHFVCDSRVLVKPYKEKGRIPDKQRKQMDRGDFVGCDNNSAGPDSRYPFDLHLDARMFYNKRDMLWRRKLEEEADLHQAMELQNQMLMSLQLLGVKRNGRTLSTLSISPPFFNQAGIIPSNNGSTQGKEVPQQPTVGLVAYDKDHFPKADEKHIINGKESVSKDNGSHDSSEHNLPDSPFASPKATQALTGPASPLSEVAPFKSCYFEARRIASGHEPIGM